MSVENEVSLPINISDVNNLQTVLDTKVENASNVGTGTGLIFRDLIAKILNFKSLKAGTNITITNNADDITINASGGGTASITPITVNISTPKNIHTVVIVDASVSPTSDIMVNWGAALDTDDNNPDSENVKFKAVASTGQFTLQISSDFELIYGKFKLNYLVG